MTAPTESLVDAETAGKFADLAYEVISTSAADRLLDIKIAALLIPNNTYDGHTLDQFLEKSSIEEIRDASDLGWGCLQDIPRFTSSIDAAKSAIPTGLFYSVGTGRRQNDAPYAWAEITGPTELEDRPSGRAVTTRVYGRDNGEVQAGTDVCALLAAALLAHAEILRIGA